MRLFVALPLPEEVARSLMLIQGGVPGARWQTREQLHLTLRFIGEVDGQGAAMLDDALAAIHVPAFELQLHAVGQFGGKKHRPRKVAPSVGTLTLPTPSGRATMKSPSALWAGVRRNERLEHLQRKVDTAIRRVGQPQDAHKFMPHVTLARLGYGEPGKVLEWLTHHALYTSVEFSVRAFSLYSSKLTSDGSIYRIEQDYPLEPLFEEKIDGEADD